MNQIEIQIILEKYPEKKPTALNYITIRSELIAIANLARDLMMKDQLAEDQ